MAHAKPSILVLGDADREEFRDARRVLDDFGAIVEAVEVEAVAAMLSSGACLPDLMVIVQSWPGQFTHEAVDRLRRLAPLARVVGLMGSWCEGEMRTGRPWPGAIRLYWHQWRPRACQELRRMLEGKLSAWGLPTTATEEERLLAESDRPWPTCAGLVAIYSVSFEMAEWLSEACRARGYATAWVRPSHSVRLGNVTAAIFDCRDLDSGQGTTELEAFAAAVRPAPVVAIMGFPRIEDIAAANAAGAAAVLSKPVSLGDLFWQFEGDAASRRIMNAAGRRVS